MATKTDFSPEEWKLLLESPMMTSMALTAAEPSGLWGMLKESFAGATDVAKAASDPGANSLVKAVATDFTTSEGRRTARDDLKAKLAGSKAADIKVKSIETLKQVSALFDTKAPADAPARFPFTDDDLASLSTILGRELLNSAPQFPTQSLTNRLRCNNNHFTASVCRRTTPARREPSLTWLHQTALHFEGYT